MREIRTEITIHSSAETVWGIVTDLDRFSEWNPFVVEATGHVAEGERLIVRISPPEGKAMTFKPTVTRAEEYREFRWLGHLVFPGLFDGEHIFEILTEAPESVRFIHRERFSGLLVPLFWESLNSNARRGFEQMNTALKERAEHAKYHNA